MTSGLATAVIAASLAMAGWAAVTAVLDRVPGTGHLIGAGVVEALALTLVGVAVAGLVAGHRPADLTTFIGYLVVAALIVPGGIVLSVMERSRWGAALIAAACLILPVLVLRLQQVWVGV